MHKTKPYKCSICGAEVPDLPMPVLKHQMSHVSRRPFARSAPEAAIAKQEIGPASSDTERATVRVGLCLLEGDEAF
jgi:hypothetical protein